MIPYSIVSFWNYLFFSSLPAVLALLVSSIAVIAVSDWYSRARAVRRESSIRALEALFELPDLREIRPRRTPR